MKQLSKVSFVRSCHRHGLKLRETRKRLGSETKSLHTRRRPSEPRPLSPSLPSCSLFDFFETALVSISTDVQGKRPVYGDSRV